MRPKTASLLGLWIFLFVVLWLRRPDSLLNAQFWAEDGATFFREQVLLGFWHSLFHAYSGYLHVVPRVVTGGLSLLPVRWIPLGNNLVSLLIQAIASSAFAWPCFRKIIESDWLRIACCFLMVALPAPGRELIGTLCNVQWHLSILSLLLLVAVDKQTSVKGEAFLTVVQALIALTAPSTILLVPFLVWQLRQNAGHFKVRPAVHLAALLVQVAMLVALVPPGQKSPLRFSALFLPALASGISRCVLSPLLGHQFLADNSEVQLLTKLVVALVVLTSGITYLTVRLWGSAYLRWFYGGMYMGVGSLLLVLYGRNLGREFWTLYGIQYTGGERYFFIGTCMFIFCVALTIDTIPLPAKRFLPMALLLACFAAGTVRNFSAPAFVDYKWKENAVKIEDWIRIRDHHGSPGQVVIPINPVTWLIVLN